MEQAAELAPLHEARVRHRARLVQQAAAAKRAAQEQTQADERARQRRLSAIRAQVGVDLSLIVPASKQPSMMYLGLHPCWAAHVWAAYSAPRQACR